MMGLSLFLREVFGDVCRAVSLMSSLEVGVGLHFMFGGSFIFLCFIHIFPVLINLVCNHGVIDLSFYCYIIKRINKLTL